MAFDWSRTAPRYKFVRFTCDGCGETATVTVPVYRVMTVCACSKMHKIRPSEEIDNPNKKEST
jgi:hypothetical protein